MISPKYVSLLILLSAASALAQPGGTPGTHTITPIGGSGGLTAGDVINIVNNNNSASSSVATNALNVSPGISNAFGFVPKTLFVSTSGNDLTGLRERRDLPFMSFAVALTNTVSGDTVFFESGSHVVTNTLVVWPQMIAVTSDSTNLATVTFTTNVGQIKLTNDVFLKNVNFIFQRLDHTFALQPPMVNFTMENCSIYSQGSLFTATFAPSNEFHFVARGCNVVASNDLFYTGNALGGSNQSTLIDGGEWSLNTAALNPIFLTFDPTDDRDMGMLDLRNLRINQTGSTNVQFLTIAANYFTNGNVRIQNVEYYLTTPTFASLNIQGPDAAINQLLELIGPSKVFVHNLTFVSNGITSRIDFPDLFTTTLFQTNGLFPVSLSNNYAYYVTAFGSSEANGFYIFKNTSGTASYFTNTLGNSGILIKDTANGYVGAAALQITNDVSGSLYYKLGTGLSGIWTEDTGSLPVGTVVYANTNVTKLVRTGAAVFAGGLAAKHFIGNSDTPTIVTNAGAGLTLGTVSIVGTDVAGTITINSGLTPSTSAAIVTVTFNIAYGSAPYVVIWPANAAAAVLALMPFATSTTTSFSLSSGAVGLGGSTTYKYNYVVVQ